MNRIPTQNLVAALLALFLSFLPQIARSAEQAERVNGFVAAFNAHDVDAMLALAHEEIEWYSVSGDKLALEVAGKSNLGRSMQEYFQGCPSCRSEVQVNGGNGRFVSAVETVSWEQEGKRRYQASVSVYEFEDGLVRRVWYFDAVPGEPSS